VTWGFTNITPALKHNLNSLKEMDQKPYELKTACSYEHHLSFELSSSAIEIEDHIPFSFIGRTRGDSLATGPMSVLILIGEFF